MEHGVVLRDYYNWGVKGYFLSFPVFFMTVWKVMNDDLVGSVWSFGGGGKRRIDSVVQARVCSN